MLNYNDFVRLVTFFYRSTLYGTFNMYSCYLGEGRLMLWVKCSYTENAEHLNVCLVKLILFTDYIIVMCLLLCTSL